MSTLRLPVPSDWVHQAHVDLESGWDRAVFRLHEAYDVRVRPGWRLELAHQPWTEVWLIRQGRCTLRLGDQTAEARPGQLVVLSPGRLRSSANESAGELALVGFGCSLLLAGTVDLIGELDLPLVIDPAGTELAALVQAVVGQARSTGADRFLRARASAELVMAGLAERGGRELAGLDDPAAAGIPRSLLLRREVRAVLDTVASRFAEPLDLAQLTEATHLSPKHAARLFHTELAVTPMAYLRRYRLLRSAELLILTDRAVTRIAHDCGFVDSAHFARAFRREFGQTARQFRDHARSSRSTDDSFTTSSPPARSLGSGHQPVPSRGVDHE